MFIINTTKKISWGLAFSIGSIWFGSHVGGGFASGNQAWNFYGQYGTVGVIVSILAMVLVGFAGREMLIAAKLYKSNSYRDWAVEAYKPIQTVGSIFFELQVWCLFILASSGAVAGCAAMLETYGVPYIVGVLITGASLVFITIFGGEVYRIAQAYMTVVLLICLTIVYVVVLVPGMENYSTNAADLAANSDASLWDAIWSGLQYVGFQIFGFVNMMSIAKDWKKRDMTAGTVLGFIMNAVMLAISIVCLICWAPVAGGTTIPILTVLQSLDGMGWVTIVYSVALFLAFVSTAAGAVFATVARVSPLKPIRKMKGSETGKNAMIAIAFIVITMLVALVGLDAIVSIGYAYVGVTAVISIVGWAVFVLIARNRKGVKARIAAGEDF